MSADPDAVRAYYGYVDEAAHEQLFALFADDVTYERPGRPTIDGMDAFRRFYREERQLTEGSHRIDALVVDDPTVAVRGRFEGKQDGDSVAFGFADFHRFDDEGKITHRWTYTDRDAV